ncbi:hypothetical protein QN089_09300 [Kurthia sp. YJT4]|uniref:hypothetical protein n=1 Tax=Kurthia sp. YJT4 TaxID=3049086 RepID=UPI00254D0D25|nr:hypothetical protein [Kurthia sp. YJT4]WIL37551.1 hypothetical protein QN089_09300 [Kurthia sp. YJT4]
MNIKRDQETEEFILTLENHEIYKDMRTKFEEVTNFGEEYLDEHAKIVNKYASEKYNIAIEEAEGIYNQTEFKIAAFHTERLRKIK